MSVRRKLAIASWGAPREGNIYGKLTLDATEALAYLEWLRETTGERVTITTLIGKAAGLALKAEPSLNGRIRMGKYKHYDTVDIAFLVQISEGADLAQVKVERIDEKSVAEISAELRARSERVRGGGDKDFNKGVKTARKIPVWLLRRMLFITGFLTTGLGIGAFGQKRFPFGACIITSVGMLGVDEAFAPPTPFARVPLYVLIGAVREQPAAVDGKIVVRPQIIITATIDHRFVDGYQAGTIAREFRKVFDNPWSLSGLDGPPALSKPARGRARKAVATS